MAEGYIVITRHSAGFVDKRGFHYALYCRPSGQQFKWYLHLLKGDGVAWDWHEEDFIGMPLLVGRYASELPPIDDCERAITGEKT